MFWGVFFRLLDYRYRLQGCNHRGDRCDQGRTQIFRYLNPMAMVGRFCPPLQRSQLTFFRGYVPERNTVVVRKISAVI